MKIEFVQKNTSKSPFLVDTNLGVLTLDAKQFDTQVNFRPSPEKLEV